ncbi:MAG TPA: AAA family ATPase, partial [Candidatus Peribacteria bacterium]|nr:AAA family ATPase [Candidatus Peribacteria bacterium]
MQPSAFAPSSTLTSCQQSAFDVMAREGNVFLTGAAGTGKSYLLEQYLHRKPSDAFPVVASTGAAAVIIGGRTFHSFFGLGIMEGGIDATVARAMRSRRLTDRLQRACCVIIDEVSMLSGTTMMVAEMIARKARNSGLPWGGLRIIAVGDFAQLPPVTPGMQQKDWAFLHNVWRESAFQPALLSTVMRTQDSDFLDILNFVRAGIVNDEVRKFLDDRMAQPSQHMEGTRLYPHRVKADTYNLQRLHGIEGPMRSFETLYEGDARAVEAAKRSLPIGDRLMLKDGALVMLRKNDVSNEQLYVNGSLGHIQSITEDTLYIKLLTGASIEVVKQKFTCLNGDGQEVAAAWNFPVSLAWATTIHKAQGASLDCMIVDLSALWEPGQAYVALSRVRSTQGLFIERWNPSSIRAEPVVTAFYDGMAQEMKSYTPRPLFLPQMLDRPEEEVAHTEVRRSPGRVRQRRAELIQRMIGKQASLEEITAACGVKADRVLLYIEDF